MDDRLKWNLHTQHVANSISKISGILYLIRNKLNSTSLRQIYSSLIYPWMLYCVPVWGGTWARHLRPVELAQKRAVRTISGARRYDHTHQMFTDLKLLKFKYIFKYFTLLLMFKALVFGYVPGTFHLPNHGYNTRLASDPRRPNPRLTLYQKSVFFKAPSIWSEYRNRLDVNVSLYVFKKSIRNTLFVEQVDNNP